MAGHAQLKFVMLEDTNSLDAAQLTTMAIKNSTERKSRSLYWPSTCETSFVTDVYLLFHLLLNEDCSL